MKEPVYIGMCSKCHTPLHWEPYWTNLFLHKRCYEENLAAVEKAQKEDNHVKTP